jgi:Zn-dependent peptidase ImmA (M78 family)
MTRVAVKPSLIRWARERAQLDVGELTNRFRKYEEWEQGEAAPTLRQLEDFARTTSTPLGYFFLDEPPDERLHVPDFRTIGDKPVARPSPDLIETVQQMERRQEWLREYLEDNHVEPLEFVGSASLNDDPDDVAARMRDVIGLAADWANKLASWDEARGRLRELIEEAGVVIVINGVVGNNTHRPLDPQEFRGFVLSDTLAPLIFVNGADAKAAQMFTMAHELAHLWLGKSALFDLPRLLPGSSRIEKFCNATAAEFLVPGRELLTAWGEALQHDQHFSVLANRFKVSPIVAARRALDLKLIDKREFFDFYDAHVSEVAAAKGRKKSSGGDFWRTQTFRVGNRFARAVISAAKEGRLLYKEAYSLLGLRGQTFEKYAKRLGL